MFEHASDLNDYYRSRQGRHVAKRLRQYLKDFWSKAPNACNAVIGYGAPVLRAEDMPIQTIFLPERLGAERWPAKGPDRTVLANSHMLPLQNVQLDRILALHALEFDSDPRHFLEECWRVLDGAGRIMVMVPNRTGLWARAERTPFGHGRPFSRRQLRDLFATNGFTVCQVRTLLFMPPVEMGLFLRFGSQIEHLGRTWSPRVGGVLCIEAEKMLYAPSGQVQRRPSAVRIKAAGLAAGSTRAMSSVVAPSDTSGTGS